MTSSVVLVYQNIGAGAVRLWCVEGDIRTAERIQEITGLKTRIAELTDFNTFLAQIGKKDPLQEIIKP